MPVIFVDPGHGGREPGAVANGIREKDINLNIALAVGQQITREYEVEVLYSRRADVFISLDERARMANRAGADLFVSFHSNGFSDSSVNGYEDYVFTRSLPRTAQIRDVFHNEVSAIWVKQGRRNRGKKQANFAVLRETRMPAILVENGFITSPRDAELLKSEPFLKELVDAHVSGIAKAMNLKKKTSAPQSLSQPATGKLYRVQVGAFRNRDNAERLVQQLKEKGFDAFIREEDV
jgi:N-acetylmuramoyl-L-alanine amidase